MWLPLLPGDGDTSRSSGLKTRQDRTRAATSIGALTRQPAQGIASFAEFGDLDIQHLDAPQCQLPCSAAVVARIQVEQFLYLPQSEASRLRLANKA